MRVEVYIDSDLTTHSTILDSISRRFLYEICRTAFPLVVSQGKTGYDISVSSPHALSISF